MDIFQPTMDSGTPGTDVDSHKQKTGVETFLNLD